MEGCLASDSTRTGCSAFNAAFFFQWQRPISCTVGCLLRAVLRLSWHCESQGCAAFSAQSPAAAWSNCARSWQKTVGSNTRASLILARQCASPRQHLWRHHPTPIVFRRLIRSNGLGHCHYTVNCCGLRAVFPRNTGARTLPGAREASSKTVAGSASQRKWTFCCN